MGTINAHHNGSCHEVTLALRLLYCSGDQIIKVGVAQYCLQGHRAICTKSYNLFVEQLKSLHCLVEFSEESVHVPSYKEKYPLVGGAVDH